MLDVISGALLSRNSCAFCSIECKRLGILAEGVSGAVSRLGNRERSCAEVILFQHLHALFANKVEMTLENRLFARFVDAMCKAGCRALIRALGVTEASRSSYLYSVCRKNCPV